MYLIYLTHTHAQTKNKVTKFFQTQVPVVMFLYRSASWPLTLNIWQLTLVSWFRSPRSWYYLFIFHITTDFIRGQLFVSFSSITPLLLIYRFNFRNCKTTRRLQGMSVVVAIQCLYTTRIYIYLIYCSMWCLSEYTLTPIEMLLIPITDTFHVLRIV